jgi:hypothetical protein
MKTKASHLVEKISTARLALSATVSQADIA